MNIQYVYTKLKYNGHKTLINTRNVPNWFERIFLRRRTHLRQFVGSGTKWQERDALGNHTLKVAKAVSNKLAQIEAGVIFDHSEAAKKGQTLSSKGRH